jgi:hypothetical protein
MCFLSFVELACNELYAGLIMESGIVGMSLRLQQAFFTIMDECTQVFFF